MSEVHGRLMTAEFTVSYRDGTVAHLPVDVKAVEVYVGSTLIQSFFASRGEVLQVAPGKYGVYIEPTLYPVATWFKAKWIVTHPSEDQEGFFELDYFLRELEPAAVEATMVGETVSEPATFGETRHLIAQEIVRRHGILMKRFIGKFVSFYLRKTGGMRCDNCWDRLEQRITRSDCQVCYATGFKGGYSDPLFGYIFMIDPERSVELSALGERKHQTTNTFWTLPYPALNPGDFFVRKDGTRWRVVTIASNKLEGDEGEQTTRQQGIVERIDQDDVEMLLKSADLRRPLETFVGFMKGITRIDDATGIVFNASGAL